MFGGMYVGEVRVSVEDGEPEQRATRATVAQYARPLQRAGRMRQTKQKFLERHLKSEDKREVRRWGAHSKQTAAELCCWGDSGLHF